MELITETPVKGRIYIDNNLFTTNKLHTPSYRILAIKDNKEYDSNEIALFSEYNRKDFGIAHRIIKEKFIKAKFDGIPVLYYPALSSGELSNNIDSETGQRMATVCDPNDESQDYGTKYAGGYSPPFITYVRLKGVKVDKQNILDIGTINEANQIMEFLAVPPVRTGDLIVDVPADRRWLVNASIKAQTLKNIPLGFEAETSLQAHSHQCYKVPIPDNYYDMLKNMERIQDKYKFNAIIS